MGQTMLNNYLNCQCAMLGFKDEHAPTCLVYQYSRLYPSSERENNTELEYVKRRKSVHALNGNSSNILNKNSNQACSSPKYSSAEQNKRSHPKPSPSLTSAGSSLPLDLSSKRPSPASADTKRPGLLPYQKSFDVLDLSVNT